MHVNLKDKGASQSLPCAKQMCSQLYTVLSVLAGNTRDEAFSNGKKVGCLAPLLSTHFKQGWVLPKAKSNIYLFRFCMLLSISDPNPFPLA